MKCNVHGISSVIFAIIKVRVSLDGIIVILLGDFDTDARGVREGVRREVVEVGVGVRGGG